MNTTETITPQYPDFGALLESVKENGRRMDENYARYLEEKKERDARWEKERAERDAKQDARLEKISAETKKAIKDMKNIFTTQWGRLVEALCKPAVF